MYRSQCLVAGFVLAVVIALVARSQAAIVPAGDLVPSDYSWWINGGGYADAYVGKSYFGMVTVSGGNALKTRSTHIGLNQSAVGRITVGGTGSIWHVLGTLYTGNRGQGSLEVASGGVVRVSSRCYVAYSAGSAGIVTIKGAGSTLDLSKNDLVIGHNGHGTVRITQGGTITSGDGTIGYWSSATGEVQITGVDSIWNVQGKLDIRQGSVSVADGGTLAASSLAVAAKGTLNVGSAGGVYVKGPFSVSGKLNLSNRSLVDIDGLTSFNEGSMLTAEPGATAHLAGLQIASRSATHFADLENLTAVFDAGNSITSVVEVAGEDLGPIMAGFENNFALGTMQVGGEDVGHVFLVDAFDNQPYWQGTEALYVKNLIVGPGSVLDLSGLNLYYLNATIDPDAIIVGGTPIQVPEPATVALLALSGLVLLKRRK